MTPADTVFVRTFFQVGGDALQAFRAAFDPDLEIPDAEALVQVTALLQREDILSELRAINRRCVIRELEEARQKAMQEPGGAHAAVAASAVKAQLLDLTPALPNPALVFPPAQSTPDGAEGQPPRKSSGGAGTVEARSGGLPMNAGPDGKGH